MTELRCYEGKWRHPPVKLPLDHWETPDHNLGGLMADISSEGMWIHTIHGIAIGVEIRIRVYLSKEEYRFDSIEGSGRIVRRDIQREPLWEGYKYDLRITQMALDDRQEITQFLQIEEERNRRDREESLNPSG